MAKDVTKTVKAACALLRKKVRFETAGFTLPGSPMFQDDTPAIREATKRYTETWIVPIINAIEDGNTNELKRLIGVG